MKGWTLCQKKKTLRRSAKDDPISTGILNKLSCDPIKVTRNDESLNSRFVGSMPMDFQL